MGHGSRVLDVATGPGYAAAAAHVRGAAVIGVDVAPAMVQLAGSLSSGHRLPRGGRGGAPVRRRLLRRCRQQLHRASPRASRSGGRRTVASARGRWGPGTHDVGPPGADAPPRTLPRGLRTGRGDTAPGHSTRPAVLPVLRRPGVRWPLARSRPGRRGGEDDRVQPPRLDRRRDLGRPADEHGPERPPSSPASPKGRNGAFARPSKRSSSRSAAVAGSTCRSR